MILEIFAYISSIDQEEQQHECWLVAALGQFFIKNFLWWRQQELDFLGTRSHVKCATPQH